MNNRRRRFEGRTALVTGAGRGIGRATALQLAEEGAAVVVNYLQGESAAGETVRLITERGGRALAARADVRVAAEIQTLVDAAVRAWGNPFDVLVNNAGLLRDKPIAFLAESEWAEILDTNLKGAFLCIKIAGRDMVRRRRGAIVNVASDAGLMGDLMRAAYSAAKAGLLGLTKTAAREFAAAGVRVNAVSPGPIETDMTAGLDAARRAKQTERIPAARFGRPEEVAEAIAFLASDDAAYITGEVLCVDGGLRM